MYPAVMESLDSGKPVAEMNLAECAMLIPIPQYPLLNPIDRPEEAKRRQGLALEALVRDGYITQEEGDAAFAESLDVKPIQERFDIVAPHFSIYVRKQLEEMFGPDLVYRGGLKVYTTLDLELNTEAERIAREQVAKLMEEGHNASNSCVVAVVPKTGEILAMVGSIDYWKWDKELESLVELLAEHLVEDEPHPFDAKEHLA